MRQNKSMFTEKRNVIMRFCFIIKTKTKFGNLNELIPLIMLNL